MDWAEIRTRVGQEVGKRSDLLRHRLGRPPATARLIDAPQRQGKFFFTASEIASRVDLFRTHLPKATEEILRDAEAICDHRFRLLGYENLDYGAEIDWHLDRVHGKRAPLDPWFRIPFLEFAAVGDHKVTWELNRHQHLVTLAKAWLLSKDEKYIRELVAQWRSWMRANPYPLGINWGSSLEVAFRSLSWIWVDQLLSDAPGHEEFHKELLPALAFHGRYIERYLSTYFSPNTHLLGEAVALFFMGTLYPQIRAGSRWREAGWKIVMHEAQRQVRPDGVYFEQSLHYQVYALDFFLYARTLAAQNGREIPAAFDALLNRMLDVAQALSQAGAPEGFGDDDGGRVFDPHRNRTEHMTDPLALGTLAYGRNNLSARLTEEAIWLFGEPAAATFAGAPQNAEPHSAAFTDGGLYILADSEPFVQLAVIDGGPQGVGRSGHGHADALSLRLTIDGERFLVDSGSGVYISGEPADRNAFRGTAAHNTMRVDGLDQAVPGDPFSWTELPTTRAENWTAGKTFSYFAGSHDGFARLADPVTHHRSVLKINGGPLLVRDLALGHQEHDLELFWHFASDLDVRDASGGVLATPKSNDGDLQKRPALNLFMHEGAPLKADVTRGLLSSAYGKLEPAPVVHCHGRVPLPAEIATILSVHPATTQESHARLVSMQHAAVQVYELSEGDQNQGFFFALGKQPWSFGPWSSDAEVLYCRIEKEHLVHLVVIGGTSVAWHGKAMLRAVVPSAFFEWRKDGVVMNADPKPWAILPLFVELTGSVSFETHDHTTYAEKH